MFKKKGLCAFFNHFSTIFQLFYTNPTPIQHQSNTNLTQVLYKSYESLAKVLHKAYANLTPIQHKASESLVHLSSETPALILFFELNEEFDQ